MLETWFVSPQVADANILLLLSALSLLPKTNLCRTVFRDVAKFV